VGRNFLKRVARLYPTFDRLEGALYRRGPRLTRRFRKRDLSQAGRATSRRALHPLPVALVGEFSMPVT